MSLIQDFRKFVMRGNLADMAIGFTVGAAFTTVAKSAVEDLIMPLVGLLVGNVDFTQKFYVLQQGKDGASQFQTMAEAQEAGAITLNYGNFINNIIALLLVAIVMFLLIRTIRRAEARLEEAAHGEKVEEGEPEDKKCGYCMETIAFKAVRCPRCTTELMGFRARRDKADAAPHELGAAAEAVAPNHP